MNRRHLIAALAAAPLLSSLARAGDAPSPVDLRGDVAILRAALALHPGLYRYATPAQVTARIAALETAFAASVSLEKRYLLLSRFLATIRCGHSYANFFNQKKAVAAALFDRPSRLPFHFRWIDGEMVVIAHGGADLPAGSVITAINGVAPRAMLDRLMPYARADGHNDAKRRSLLEVRGADNIEYFDVFHGLLYGVPRGGVHHVTAQLPHGRTVTLDLPAIDLAARRAQTVTPDYRGSAPVWGWTVRPDGVALLTMPGWALYDSKWDWRGWLTARLDTLAGARGLIIDLRENEGGEDCGDMILARLIASPIVDPGAERRVRYRRTPPTLDRYLDTWDDSFRTVGEGATPLRDGFFRLEGDKGDSSIAPVAPQINLPVAALIGPVNSSATFGFAANARRSGKVRLFGETTGGNQRGINGGRFFFVRLPASELEFDLPLIGYYPPGSPPDAGLAPDVRVATSAADIAAGRDPVLAAATAWIKG